MMLLMPIVYLRGLTGSARTESANRHLARYLAFLAGAANAGGFFALRQYTSHMSGIVAGMADNLALGSVVLAAHGLAAVLSFLSGALLTTILVRWGRARRLESLYALPLLLEALLLLLFGLTGRVFAGGRMLGTTMLLCFTMGLQNALITKISNSVIRTTHITGMVTDIGILLGRMLMGAEERAAETMSLRLLSSLVTLFFLGGVTGALGFRQIGFFFTWPLAGMLVVLALWPVLLDLREAMS